MSAPLQAALSPLPALDALEQRWRALEHPGTSFFLTWTWIGSWLRASGATPMLLSITQGGQDQALALVGQAKRKRLLGSASTLLLNEAGDPDADRPFIEYNGLLTAADAPAGIEAAAMAALFRQTGWRALRLSGVAPDAPLAKLGRFRRRVRTGVSPAYYIDLRAVRHAGGDYLSCLSSNTRSQIKRSAKDHGADVGETTRADDPAAIETGLQDMAAMNAGRHADNAWDHAGFRAFAREICLAGLEDGSVELIALAQGGHRLGYLINFLRGGLAMNYQSAFAEPLTPKSKPGLMAHAAAVARYADFGFDRYSLLAGKDRYKQSLSTGEETLEWWTLERFSPVLEAESLLRRVLKRPAGE